MNPIIDAIIRSNKSVGQEVEEATSPTQEATSPTQEATSPTQEELRVARKAYLAANTATIRAYEAYVRADNLCDALKQAYEQLREKSTNPASS